MLTTADVSYKVVPKTVASRRVADICYILESTCECERCVSSKWSRGITNQKQVRRDRRKGMGDERTKEKQKRMKKKRGRKKRNSGRKSVRTDIPFATQNSEPNTQITLRRPQVLLLSFTLYTRSQIRLAFPPPSHASVLDLLRAGCIQSPEPGWSRNA